MSGLKVFVLAQHAPQAPRLQALLGPGPIVTGMASLPSDGLIDAEVLVTTHLSAEQAVRWRGRLLQVPGAGLDGIARDAVWPGCTICNVHGHEIPMAEFAMLAMLEHRIRLAEMPSHLDAATWPAAYAGRPLHGEVAGQRLAIIGFGHIGREVAHRARAFGMGVVAVTRTGAPEPLADRAVPASRLLEVLPEVDVVLLCCPLTEQTRGLIGAAALAAMRPTALLINLARAEVADEAALFTALREQRIGGAFLDVWYRYPRQGEVELAPSRFPFHTLPNTRCTPHSSAWTLPLLERRYALIARNIRRLWEGGDFEHLLRAGAPEAVV
ncbi:MAG TPA: 2-hydroxyacid dehydrogenase [Roseomonas sp.]|nr:2-hydroxyacid dehydrogenase [Roseomonas sp.]